MRSAAIRFRSLLVLASVVGLIALGVVTTLALKRGESAPSPQLQCPPPGATAIPINKTTGPPGRVTGLGPEEMRASLLEAYAIFQERSRAWREDFIAKGYDVACLPRVWSIANYGNEGLDLREAVKRADLIVSGEAVRVEVSQGPSEVIFKIHDVIKPSDGIDREEVVLLMPGSPVADDGYVSGVGKLVDSPAAPLLLPGDEALLFLVEKKGESLLERYYVQNFVGHYRVSNDRIEALEGNLFRDQVNGLKTSKFVEQIEALLKE